MSVILNINNSIANQEQTFQIEGIVFIINTYWNVRSGWYVSISKEDETPLITGLKVMPDANITWRYSRVDGLFTGDLWVIDTEAQNKDKTITRESFGQNQRFQLIYISEDEQNTLGINPREI